jgi:preprotein translocase subunit SecD
MSRRAAIVTLSITLLLSWGSLVLTQALGISPKLGLDLQGGFSVLLEAPAGTDKAVLEKAVEVMRRRIEALGGVQEPEISIVGDRNVAVQLPGITDRQRALAAVGTTGQLAFRPVLEANGYGVSPLVLAAAAEESASTTTTTVPSGETTTTAAGGTSTTVAGSTTTVGPSTTTTAAATTTTSSSTTSTTIAGDSATSTTVPGETTTTTVGQVTYDLTKVLPAGITICDAQRLLTEQLGCVDGTTGLTLSDDPAKDAWYVEPKTGEAFHLAPARILGSDLSGAEAKFTQSGSGGGGVPFGVSGGGIGEFVVELIFNSAGGDKFQQVTKELAAFSEGDPRRRFAIVLDGVVQSAPQIDPEVDPATGISGGSAIITLGNAPNQEQEARDLAVVLRYGSLPVAFAQPSVVQVSATLGSDSLRAGLFAGVGGLILVAAAMILYYRALGLVNVIGLTVFGSVVLVIFSLLGKAQGVSLTLAGVAGVIVSIGITSDSYVVYFERIKEEVHRGRSLRSAIDHGFLRAFRTMLTADAVSFAGAALLFMLAVGSVRGFALALGIATVTDLAVTYFFTKPAVSLLARTRLGEGGWFSVRGATGVAKEAAQ